MEVKTNTNFDGTQKFGASSVHVPAAYRKPKKLSPGQLLDLMQKADHKGPISHKVVSQNEFERLAKRQKDMDGGKPMVEKTIFIVKPIYVPIEVSRGRAGADGNLDTIGGASLTTKKKLKLKKKVQTAIYMERPKPPNYTNPMSTALTEKKTRKRASIDKKRDS